MGINPYQLGYSLYYALVQPEKYPFKKVVVQTQYGVDLLPATENLYMIELDLVRAIGGEVQLKKLLKVASLSYDYILMQINGLNVALWFVEIQTMTDIGFDCICNDTSNVN
ncbi:ParA family protein [Bernardetia litoralis]|uniref:ParA family protein n=1 Tax=Bernardetia litoralis TaxID=999 RepID=UPI000315C7C7|nr:AAA family ATPase [Bernardetia litoralis]